MLHESNIVSPDICAERKGYGVDANFGGSVKAPGDVILLIGPAGPGGVMTSRTGPANGGVIRGASGGDLREALTATEVALFRRDGN